MGSARPSRQLLDRLRRNLRRARQARGWSQADLAAQLGVSKSLISRIEQGRANITLATVEQLASALGVTPADLLS
jgi:transcriptional regulator with XRE-family HTH domain